VTIQFLYSYNMGLIGFCQDVIHFSDGIFPKENHYKIVTNKKTETSIFAHLDLLFGNG